MYLLVQLTMCFLAFAIYGNIISLALLRQGDLGIVLFRNGDSMYRVRRQDPIVQPTWFMNSEGSPFEDYNVKVTEKKLEETEAIRDYIQETVDNGTYVVELDKADFKKDESKSNEEIPAEEFSEPAPELEVEVRSTTVPPPAPNPEPSSGPKQIPPSQTKQTNERQPTFFKQFRIIPRRYSTLTGPGSPFLSWLKQKFNP